MYINDPINRVNKLYPSEYSALEMYQWCDEVSAMLAVEDRQIYREIILSYLPQILLPEGVGFEYITNVYAVSGGREYELTKRDWRTIPYHGRNLLEVLPGCDRLRIVYAMPYTPLRVIIYEGAIELDKTNNTIHIIDNEFMPGDTLVIKISDNEYIENVHVLASAADPDDLRSTFLTINDGALDGASVTEITSGKIQRVVTDKTLCDAPYEVMYIDYIRAMIAKFQHDTAGYNQHISSFNSRLAAYRRWLVDKLPYDDAKFINYW